MVYLAASMKILEAFKVEDFLHCDPNQNNNHQIFILRTVRNMKSLSSRFLKNLHFLNI